MQQEQNTNRKKNPRSNPDESDEDDNDVIKKNSAKCTLINNSRMAMSRNIRFFFGSRLFAFFARSHYTSLISMAWRAVSVAHHFNEIMVYKTDLLFFRVCASGAMRMLRTTPSQYPRSHAIIRSRAKD